MIRERALRRSVGAGWLAITLAITAGCASTLEVLDEADSAEPRDAEVQASNNIATTTAQLETVSPSSTSAAVAVSDDSAAVEAAEIDQPTPSSTSAAVAVSDDSAAVEAAEIDQPTPSPTSAAVAVSDDSAAVEAAEIDQPTPSPTSAAAAVESTASENTATNTTLPSSETTSQDDAVVSDTPGLGIIMAPSGVVLPVREMREDSYLVGTTCANELVVKGGMHIERADVVLDPGHGGSESGAVGANGLAEKDLNVAVAELVRAELQDRGYSALLTRSSDIRMPTVTRAEIALALSARAFVSIHHNGGATRSSPDPGTEVFHQAHSADSLRLAGILFEDVQAALHQYDVDWVASGNKGTRAFLRTRDNRDLFGVLRHSEGLPAVIVEAAYLSNPPEATLLADPAVQAVEARAIANGIIRFLTTEDQGSGFNGVVTTDRVLTTGGRERCVDPLLN